MDEFETVENDWDELETDFDEDLAYELSEPTSDDLEREFAEILGY